MQGLYHDLRECMFSPCVVYLYALEASEYLLHVDCSEMHVIQHTLQICSPPQPHSFRLLHWCVCLASLLNQSHICQARPPTLTCGSFNHICSQLRLENQVSCGLHITATLSPVYQHAHTFEHSQHQVKSL